MPPDCVLYAVGDIHGRADLLARMLDIIAADTPEPPVERRLLVCLGDYVDRGPDSKGVIDCLLSDLPPGLAPCFLKGNHEDLMLRALADPAAVPHWLINGGDATLASYGIAPVGDPEGLRERFAAALPTAHAAFLDSLALQFACGDYLFVHAGVRPGVPLDRQTPHDLIWIREAFLDSDADFGAVVVHGHTPTEVPVLRVNRIGIDTLAWASGRLTALRLQGARQTLLTAS